MSRDKVIFKETYHKGRLRIRDHESLTALQKVAFMNDNGRVMSADAISSTLYDRGGTRLKYLVIGVWLEPYKKPASQGAISPHDPDR